MKQSILLIAGLAACQPTSDNTEASPVETIISTETKAIVKAGAVRLRLKPPVSERLACIIPIVVENGLADEARVTMIAFSLSGSGEDAKGNMFAPAAGAGDISEARVIVEGQSCDAYDIITIPEIRCTSGGESCEGLVEFIDGKALRFTKAG